MRKGGMKVLKIVDEEGKEVDDEVAQEIVWPPEDVVGVVKLEFQQGMFEDEEGKGAMREFDVVRVDDDGKDETVEKEEADSGKFSCRHATCISSTSPSGFISSSSSDSGGVSSCVKPIRRL